jgi:26S proteasome regulatory subunit N7
MEEEQTRDDIKVEEFEKQIKDALDNEGDIEVRDAIIKLAEYYLNLKNYKKARATYLRALEKTAGNQKKLEYNLVILYTLNKEEKVAEYKKYLKICQELLGEDGDWENKNKLIVYEGILMMIERNFKKGAELFLGCVNTFNAPEIITFDQLVYYGCTLGLLTLNRKDIKKKIIDNSEIISVLREDDLLYNFVFSFFNCDYSNFFKNLTSMTENYILKDNYLKNHKNYIIKQAKIVIYKQYLESYKTVRISKMAQDFKVREDFIDEELSELIASKKLNCQIDKVNGVVESTKGDVRMDLYKQIIKKGDNIIERIHHLVRISNL